MEEGKRVKKRERERDKGEVRESRGERKEDERMREIQTDHRHRSPARHKLYTKP